MAYNVYVACDCCGEKLFAITNETVSITRAEKAAKLKGWKVTQDGWYCQDCLWKTKPPPVREEEPEILEEPDLLEYPD